MTSTTGTETTASPSNWVWKGLVDNLPYVAIIVLGLVGISWTSISMSPQATYWVYVTPIIGLICIFAGWRHTDRGERLGMAIAQVLQWAGMMIAMYLLTVSDAQRPPNINALSLMILTILALGVFVSGIHLRAWKLAVTGAFLAVAVPAIAWLQDAALLLLLAGIVLIALLFAYWWLRDRFSEA
jgi:hypothetical protein